MSDKFWFNAWYILNCDIDGTEEPQQHEVYFPCGCTYQEAVMYAKDWCRDHNRGLADVSNHIWPDIAVTYTDECYE
jgi:hypothetical protein